MINIYNKIKNNRIFSYILDKMSTPYFGVALLIINLVCYYLALDIVAIYIYGFIIGSLFLFKEDLSPILIAFTFLTTIISKEHSPSTAVLNPSDYYYNPVIYIQITVILTILGICVFARLIDSFIKHKVKINSFFISSAILLIAYLTNGFFSSSYVLGDTIFSLIMIFFQIICVITLVSNIKLDKENMLITSKNMMAFSVMLVVELVILYIFDSPIVNGVINKEPPNLSWGWGIWNTMGMVLNISLPFVFYLMIKSKKWYLYLSYSLLISICVFLTASKSSYIGLFISIIMFVIYLIFFKASLSIRKLAIKTAIGGLVALVILSVLFFDKIASFVDFFKNIDARAYLYKDAIEVFINNPILGGGFFNHGEDGGYGFVGVTNIIPSTCCNTVLELFKAGGLFLGGSYLVYRFITIKEFFKIKNEERFFVAISLTSFLIMSLLDIHIFSIFGTMIYGSLTGLIFSYKD